MNISAPFIRRPVATILLSCGIFLIGSLAYFFLPIASLPSFELPAIVVWAQHPGASPSNVASTIAAPIERHIGSISGINEMTSSSSQGSTQIVILFDFERHIDDAGRDVDAALSAAQRDLPKDLGMSPRMQKINPSSAPILILALTSKTLSRSALYSVAENVISPRISQIDGVAQVNVNGSDQPAIRIRANATRFSAMGLSLEDIHQAVAGANVLLPIGDIQVGENAYVLSMNGQLFQPSDYANILLPSTKGPPVRLGDVAQIEWSVANVRSAAWFNQEPAVTLFVSKKPNANVINTVDKIKNLLPELQRWIPAGIEVSILNDRTATIRSSIEDLEITLLITVALVMGVVFLFLRKSLPTLAAAVTVPLSLAGTFAAMWASGFSLNNFSLMAVIISVGFVVDDAIVVIENIYHNIEKGYDHFTAALVGTKQIGFTVVSITLSLVAVFIPFLFIGNMAGRIFKEFSMTLTFAILISMVVSLTVTPMICARPFKRRLTRQGTQEESPKKSISHQLQNRSQTWRFFTRLWEILPSFFTLTMRGYRRSLEVALTHPWLMLMVMALTIVLTIELYKFVPKGVFPEDDTGVLIVSTEASPGIAFPAMSKLQQEAMKIISTDPAVKNTASSIGGNVGLMNEGKIYVTLKTLLERKGENSKAIISRLRKNLAPIVGLEVFVRTMQDMGGGGGKERKGQYPFSIWGPDVDALMYWVPKIAERLKAIPGLRDVTTDQEAGGSVVNVKVDRAAASRLGIHLAHIDQALYNAFAQRAISTVHTPLDSYNVILETASNQQLTPSDLEKIYVPNEEGRQIPLASFVSLQRTTFPLAVNHKRHFPSATISYNLSASLRVEESMDLIEDAVKELQLPESIHTEFEGESRDLARQANEFLILMLTALIAIYIILGILYESFIHPITILSTLPSAGLGALLALLWFDFEFTVIAFIGIILLMGIVKKNGIMMVDFALEVQRTQNISQRDAILQAAIQRFRPILMTTLAAILGALPLVIASGASAEMRRPLGVTVIGGLIVSQLLTLYTTPVIYLLLSKLQRKKKLQNDETETKVRKTKLSFHRRLLTFKNWGT